MFSHGGYVMSIKLSKQVFEERRDNQIIGGNISKVSRNIPIRNEGWDKLNYGNPFENKYNTNNSANTNPEEKKPEK